MTARKINYLRSIIILFNQNEKACISINTFRPFRLQALLEQQEPVL